MIPRPPSSRLRTLIERRLDGSITRVELAELEDLLCDPASLDYYLQACEVESGLQQLASKGELADDLPAAQSVAMPSDDRRLLLASAAAVILLLFSLGVFLVVREARHDPPRAGVQSATVTSGLPAAKVMRRIGATVLPTDELRTGDSLAFGPGLVEVVFLDGARLILEGPADLRIEGLSRINLLRGRCVVQVPPATSPFVVATAQSEVQAADSEFALEVGDSEEKLSIGVYEGRAFLHPASAERPIAVNRRHALQEGADGSVRSIAFPFDSFQRRFPSRELTWKAPTDSFEPVDIEHDLTGLIWGPGHYRVYFKWMHGADALIIHSAAILFDGEPVVSDVHSGMAGNYRHTRDNAYRFTIPEGDYERGRWTLRSTIQTNPRHLGQIQFPEHLLASDGQTSIDDPRQNDERERFRRTITAAPDSHGVLLVEEGHPATPVDFCATWEYTYHGQTYRRVFHLDGSAQFIKEGVALPNFDRSSWIVEDGVLILTIRDPRNGAFQCVERHLLRNNDTLLFLDRPYRSARRVVSSAAE